MIIMILAVILKKNIARQHYVYWNTSNPMFSSSFAQNLIIVNEHSEFDQLHLYCPENRQEKHVIYKVSRNEYETCKVINPSPADTVMICDDSTRGQFRTITFRPLSPSPGGLEFKPGQEYYLISTSSPRNIHSRSKGACASHNMKLRIRLAKNDGAAYKKLNQKESRHDSYRTSQYRTAEHLEGQNIRSSEYIYYYSPRDLLQLKLRSGFNHLSKLSGQKIDPSEQLSLSSCSLPCGNMLLLILSTFFLKTSFIKLEEV